MTLKIKVICFSDIVICFLKFIKFLYIIEKDSKIFFKEGVKGRGNVEFFS